MISKCPRCNSRVFKEMDDLVCISCGWRLVSDEELYTSHDHTSSLFKAAYFSISKYGRSSSWASAIMQEDQ